jgi:electron transport complex protein RnfB
VTDDQPKLTRRDVLRRGLRGACAVGLTGTVGALAATGRSGEKLVWQLDPLKCNQCGKCATNCVLEISAVRCVHAFAMCGYCDLCTGYFNPGAANLNTGGENQLCPTGALKRSFIEDPYYQYTIDEELCVGCAKCVKGCGSFGNGSLFLQVRHDRCLNCNDCSIAAACPTQAFRRVPASRPYLLKQVKGAE